jgi:hypothetical protein
MKRIFLIPVTIGVLAGCALPGQPPAQQQANPEDPTAVMQQLLRGEMEDIARRRADQQKERIQKEQEEAYDRQMCLKAGYRGPDIDQCVRDSAEYRRKGNDFSAWGTPAERSQNRRSFDCVTLGDGLGGGITDCN